MIDNLIIKEFRERFTGLPSCKVEIEGEKQTLFFPDIEQFLLEKVKQAEDKGYAEGVRLTEKKYQGEILEAIEKTVEERNNFWRTIIKDASSSQKEAREEARREVMDKIINIIAKRMVESKTDKEVDFGQDVLKQLTEI